MAKQIEIKARDNKLIEQLIRLSVVNEEIGGHISVAWKLSELLDLDTSVVTGLAEELREKFNEIWEIYSRIEEEIEEAIMKEREE